MLISNKNVVLGSSVTHEMSKKERVFIQPEPALVTTQPLSDG